MKKRTYYFRKIDTYNRQSSPKQDIVQSFSQQNASQNSLQRTKIQQTAVKKNHISQNLLQKEIKNGSGGSKLTIMQIKQQILKHAPEMREQINILDDETLRQIYESIVQPHREDSPKEETKLNNSQRDREFQQSKQSNVLQSYPQKKYTQRSPEVQKMLQQIVKNVPHMKSQVQTFDDNEIRELYESIEGFSKNQKQPPTNKILTVNAHPNIEEIRRMLQQKIPQMKQQLKYLSDEDMLEVYEQYVEKEKPKQQFNFNHLQNDAQLQQFNRSYSRCYDPPKKYQNQNFNSNGMEEQFGWFNNYKYGNNNKLIEQNVSGRGIKAPKNQNSYHSNYLNPLQVHAFHNNQRVSKMPQCPQNYARTVVIFHTMDPGYVPVTSKLKCKCPCCLKRQIESPDNALNGFIQQLMLKYSNKR